MSSMMWNWQEALSKKYTKEELFSDCISEDSIFFTMAKEDVAKVLNKTNYSFIVQKLNFDDIYSIASEITKRQINNYLLNKKSFLQGDFTKEEILLKLVSRIANNIKNLFNANYKTCIKKNLFNLHKEIETIDEFDSLSLMILEEEHREYEIKIIKMDSEYIEYVTTVTKIDERDGQTSLTFN